MDTFGFLGQQQPATAPQPAAQPLGGAQQHSAMLAQALQNLQQTGGQNLRTPQALGGNLLADALLNYQNRQQGPQASVTTPTPQQAYPQQPVAMQPGIDPNQQLDFSNLAALFGGG